MDLSSTGSVLVIKPSSLGDVVHALPAVNLVAKRYPELELRWVVDRKWAPLLEGHPALAGTIVFPREDFRGPRGWYRFFRWARGLKAFEAEVALDFQGLLRSALMARLSGAGRIVGMSDAREGAGCFFSETVEVDRSGHAVSRYLAMAEALGAGGAEGAPEYRLPSGVAVEGRELPDEFVLLHPYSRGEGKTLAAAQRKRFCEKLAPTAVVVVGVAAGSDPGGLPENAIDLTNETNLLELLWLMRRARFTVSVDSGPMHLAAAVNPRLLGIHTWTDPRKVGPYCSGGWVWKAGAIRRVGELAPDDDSLVENRGAKVSGIGDTDIDTMAAFVAEEVASS